MTLVLQVVQGRPTGKTLRFAQGQYFLGRGPECHVRFNTDWVSRQHCLLRVTPRQAFLRDLGSLNGTLVNGQLLAGEQEIGDGDQIQIGPVLLRAHLEAASGSGLPPVAGEMLTPSDQENGDEPPTDSTAHHPFHTDDL